MLASDIGMPVRPVEIEEMETGASEADEQMPMAAEQAKAILGLEEEGWPHRQGDSMALISCE